MATSIGRIRGIVSSSALLGNFCAYAASEGASKISRLVVVVVLAHMLTPGDIGLAAAAMATSDILKSLTENGVGQRIIIASDERLETECNVAYRIFWVWCGSLFVLQAGLAALLWKFGSSTLSFLLLLALASEYLMMPGGLVQCALAMRQGRLRNTALISGAQNVSANLLTCVLAFIVPGPWALVAPKILTGPIWLIGMRRLVQWQPGRNYDVTAVIPFIRFGLPVLGVELLKAIRQQADKLIVGALLGSNALGIYFFAYNASTGISMALSSAFSTVIFPYLSRSDNRRQALRNALYLSLAIISPIVLLQAFAAHSYVSLIFGEKWIDVAPLVSILCFTAISSMVWSVGAQWLRSNDRAGIEFAWSLVIGIAVCTATTIAAPFGLTAIAWASLIVTTISQTLASIPALLRAFGPELPAKTSYATSGA